MRRWILLALLAGCGGDFITTNLCARYPGRACLQILLQACGFSGAPSDFDQLAIVDESGTATPFVPGGAAFTPTPSPSPFGLPVETAVVPDQSWPGGAYSIQVCAYLGGQLVGAGGTQHGTLQLGQHDSISECAASPMGESCPLPTRFKPANSSTAAGLLNVWGSGPNDVYAVGFSGAIVHSSDRGVTWTVQTAPTQKRLDGIWGSSANDLYATGAGGTILHGDGGGNWIAEDGGVGQVALHRVWGSGPNDVYVVGDGGTILHSTVPGQWKALSSGTTLDLWDIGGAGANRIYAVGSGGAILRSIDFGTSWGPLGHRSEDFVGVWPVDADVFVVGYNGIILHSGDGVAFDVVSDPGVQAEMDRVWGPSATDIWIPTAGGGLLHSTDRGMNWLPVATGTTADLYAVWGSAANDIYVMGSGGTILHGP